MVGPSIIRRKQSLFIIMDDDAYQLAGLLYSLGDTIESRQLVRWIFVAVAELFDLD